MAGGLLPALPVGAATVEQLALAWIAASVAGRAWLEGQGGPWCLDAGRKLHAVEWPALAVLIAASVARLGFAAAAMADVDLAAAGPVVVGMLRESHYGQAWSIGLLAAALLAAAFRRGSIGGARLAWAALGYVLYAGALSSVSHAGEAGDMSWKVGLDTLHRIVTGLWVGGVMMAGAVVLRRPPPADAAGRGARIRFVFALSAAATLALAGVLATGVIRAWLVFPSLASLVDTAAGQVLLIKLSLVMLAIGLGAFNRFIMLPRLVRGRAATGLAEVLGTEAIVLALVMVAATLLGELPPP